jgi:phospholipid-translocating ATPase
MKSLVTEMLCQEMNKIVLAIGDGGNDVGMIQIANVGIGILGKEGNQAALAADFNINQFRYFYNFYLSYVFFYVTLCLIKVI